MPEEKKIDPVMAMYATYYLSLGRFIQNFADAEVMTTLILAHFAQTSPEVSQAIFSGTRGKDAISYINRICEAQHRPQDADLKSAFSQFQILNDARNTILHHGAKIDGDGLIATNDAMAHLLPRTIKKLPVSSAILDEMALDAETIRVKLSLFMMRGRTTLFPDLAQRFAAIAARPWFYKSPPQASPPRKIPDKSAKHPRQQKSSRKKS